MPKFVYNHFHAIYKYKLKTIELEASLTPLDNIGIHTMADAIGSGDCTQEVYDEWKRQFQLACCLSFGMPKDAVIEEFHVTGD
jgi:hypothetical protein